MNAEINKLIKKTKRRRRFLIFLFVFTVAVSILFLGKIEVGMTDGQSIRYCGAGLPGYAVALIVFAEIVLFFFIGVIEVGRVENVLLNDCDPEKYFALRSSMNRYMTKPCEIASGCATAAFAGGDFNSCMNYAMQFANDKKPEYRFASAVAVFMSSYFLGNRENMTIALERAKADSNPGKAGQKNEAAIIRRLEMLSLLSDGNVEAALQTADSLPPSDNTNYTIAFNSFYKGLVYRAANEKIKAIHCFMTASEKGGKLFIKAESDRYIKEYEAQQNESSQQTT